jgi:hypothetical protein
MKPKVGRRRRADRRGVRKPALRGNFIVAVNGAIKGGWPNSSPRTLRTMINELEEGCRTNDIDLTQDGVEAIIESFMDDGYEFDEADGAMVLWWLAHYDEQWPSMMSRFGRGTDFKVDVTRQRTGKPEAIVYSMPTPEKNIVNERH